MPTQITISHAAAFMLQLRYAADVVFTIVMRQLPMPLLSRQLSPRRRLRV